MCASRMQCMKGRSRIYAFHKWKQNVSLTFNLQRPRFNHPWVLEACAKYEETSWRCFCDVTSRRIGRTWGQWPLTFNQHVEHVLCTVTLRCEPVSHSSRLYGGLFHLLSDWNQPSARAGGFLAFLSVVTNLNTHLLLPVVLDTGRTTGEMQFSHYAICYGAPLLQTSHDVALVYPPCYVLLLFTSVWVKHLPG